MFLIERGMYIARSILCFIGIIIITSSPNVYVIIRWICWERESGPATIYRWAKNPTTISYFYR